jgi:hypothetical protein
LVCCVVRWEKGLTPIVTDDTDKDEKHIKENNE